MDRITAKLVALVGTFLIIFICTALPVKVHSAFLKRGEMGLKVIAVLMCFGGGVFFGTYLMHMAPEIRHVLEEKLLIPYDIDYPLPELFIGFGFFFVMFLEKLMHHLTSDSGSKSDKKDEKKDKTLSKKKVGAEEVPEVSVVQLNTIRQLDANSLPDLQNDETKSTEMITSAGKEAACEQTGNVNVAMDKFYDENDHLHLEHSHADHHHHHHIAPAETNVFKALLLMMALSVDSVFEGLSLGLMPDNNGVWTMFIAINSHEWVIGFTLGLELIKSNPPKRVLLYAFIYSLMSPIGIAIGMAISETSNSESDTMEIVAASLQGMSAGVFIYCTFFEILLEHLTAHTPLANLIGVLLGYAFMAAMAAIPHEVDSPDGNATIHHSHYGRRYQYQQPLHY